MEGFNLILEDRIVNNFLNMLKQESPSFKELTMGKWLIEYFNKRNIDVFMDQIAVKTGGDCGNIIAYIKSNSESKSKPMCFCAHIDQIPPCCNIVPKIEDNLIKTDGRTTLGGDDKAGIAAILEALEHILEEDLPHREMYLLFTVCEEVGLLGSKNLDVSMIPVEDIVIVDAAGSAGIVAYKAPGMNTIEVTFKGIKAHAGIEPEKGLSAIKIAAEAISLMHIGRIDYETTSNIGIIQGGEANNIVPDNVRITAEIRSHSREKLKYEINHMNECCKIVADKYNSSFEFKCDLEFPQMELSKESYVYNLCVNSFKAEGIEPKTLIIGGGSDANVLSSKGFNCAIISVGMSNVHTVNETLNINDMLDTTKVIVRMMKA
jgi:tripeptide aminopeptidase